MTADARAAISTVAACVAAASLAAPTLARAGAVVVGTPPPAVRSLVAGEENGLLVQHGVAGATVEVYGEGFTGATAVYFGAAPASFRVRGLGYRLEAIAPPGSGTVDVTVSTAAGTSERSFGDLFTYVLPAPDLSPAPLSSTVANGAAARGEDGPAAGSQSTPGRSSAPWCRVPKLLGDSLAAARRALRAAHCRLGRVRRGGRARGELVVVWQAAQAGDQAPSGTRVSVRVGSVRRRRR